MNSLPSILAAEDYAGLIKGVLFVIVLIIWGISAMVSTIKKAQTQARQRQGRSPIPPRVPTQLRAAPPALRPTVAPQRPMILPPLPALIRPQPPARPTARRPPPNSAAPARLPATASAAPPKAAPPPSPAPAATTGLLRPTTVRAQFILAEVLQPPLALRTKRNF
jgi:hypothetical protein